MSPHPYTEDQLVEQPAIALLAELGWTTVNALDEVLGLDGTFGRETKSDVVLAVHLRAALVRLNPDAPAEAITAAIDQLVVNRSAMSLVAANREVYLLLKEGVPVSVREPERGGQRTLRVRVIDWENTSNNDFLFVSQFSITGSLYTCRPDLVGFVNGLPLIVIELKKPGVPAKQAFDENLTSYKHEHNGVPPLFWYNAFVIASNGTPTRTRDASRIADHLGLTACILSWTLVKMPVEGTNHMMPLRIPKRSHRSRLRRSPLVAFWIGIAIFPTAPATTSPRRRARPKFPVCGDLVLERVR
jgi:type I restriction enzyme R subunit